MSKMKSYWQNQQEQQEVNFMYNQKSQVNFMQGMEEYLAKKQAKKAKETEELSRKGFVAESIV